MDKYLSELDALFRKFDIPFRYNKSPTKIWLYGCPVGLDDIGWNLTQLLLKCEYVSTDVRNQVIDRKRKFDIQYDSRKFVSSNIKMITQFKNHGYQIMSNLLVSNKFIEIKYLLNGAEILKLTQPEVIEIRARGYGISQIRVPLKANINSVEVSGKHLNMDPYGGHFCWRPGDYSKKLTFKLITLIESDMKYININHGYIQKDRDEFKRFWMSSEGKRGSNGRKK